MQSMFPVRHGVQTMSDPLLRQPGGYALVQASDKTTVVVVYALYLAGYVTAGLTTVVGLIMIYVLRAQASDIARTHYRFLVRTFWLGMLWAAAGWLLFIVGLPLTLILIGIPLLLLAKLVWVVTAIWYGVRCVAGLLAAMENRAYGTPESWLI